MRIQKFLVITALKSRYSGFNHKIEIREKTPSLDGMQIAVKLDIEIPDALFQRPTLEAKMTIPEEAVPKLSLDANVTENISRLIKDATGLTMKVTVVEQEKELPYEKPDVIDRESGDYTNLQKFKVGQKVKFYIENPDDSYAGIHVIKAIEKADVGHVIQTDRSGEQWIHVHWFAPVRK